MATATARSTSPMCAKFSMDNNEDPGGSAPNWDRCLILELPQPWNEIVENSHHFPASVKETLDREGNDDHETRLQCVLPDPEYTAPGYTRVMLFTRPDEQFTKYLKVDFQVPHKDLGSLVNSLLVKDGKIGQFDAYRQDTSNKRDLLVCTHGNRDACCATFGFPVYQTLRHQIAPLMSENLRVWRTSHLGGHRFAPNFLDLPEGRSWVRADENDLNALVNRQLPASDMIHLYRGWAGLNSPSEQIVEREILSQVGWQWTQYKSSGEVVRKSEDGLQVEVRIKYTDTSRRSGTYEATVKQTRAAPRVDCMTGDASNPTPQFKVTSMAHLS